MCQQNTSSNSPPFNSVWIFLILLEAHKVVVATNIYVWPLGYEAMNSEVKTNGQGGSVGDITLAAGPAALDYQAFAFKGTATSYVDLRVPASTPLNNDCTFLFYIYLETNADGVLFHFESDDVNTDDAFTGIDVTFDSSNIMFDFTGDSNSWAGGSDSVSNTIPTGQWVAVALAWDYSSKRKKLYIDGAVTAVDGGPKNIGIGLPGTIRIGHSRPSSSSPASLTGRVACFMIQDVLYNHGSLNTDIQDCKSSNWVLTPAPCSPECTSFKGYFFLADSGKVPLNGLPRLDSGTYARYTSRWCAGMCLANTNCVSFVTKQSANYCETFSGDYSQFMETSSAGDSKYYVRRDKCCM